MTRPGGGARGWGQGAGPGGGARARPNLQTAEDGEHVVEGHDVAVDGQQPQQPGGADEQQQQEGHPKSRAGGVREHTQEHMNADAHRNT